MARAPASLVSRLFAVLFSFRFVAFCLGGPCAVFARHKRLLNVYPAQHIVSPHHLLLSSSLALLLLLFRRRNPAPFSHSPGSPLHPRVPLTLSWAPHAKPSLQDAGALRIENALTFSAPRSLSEKLRISFPQHSGGVLVEPKRRSYQSSVLLFVGSAVAMLERQPVGSFCRGGCPMLVRLP